MKKIYIGGLFCLLFGVSYAHAILPWGTTALYPTVSTTTADSLSVKWNYTGTLYASTPSYTAILASDPKFTMLIASVTSTDSFAIYQGLQPSTTYYFHAKLSSESDSSYWFNSANSQTLTAPPPQTVYVLSQDELNGIKQQVWIDVFKNIVDLRPEFFVGIATGDWAVNASTGNPSWVPVSVDTTTGYACFISSPSVLSWDDTFKLNLDNELLNDSWDDVTWPLTEFDSIDDVETLSRFH